MIRTGRLFFPIRNSYNVSIFNQRTSQPKQISVGFSFYTEQGKEIYLQKKSCERVRFSTYKEHENVEQERNQRKTKDNLTDYVAFKANKKVQKEQNSVLNKSDEKMNIDFSTFKENLKSKSATNKLDVEPVSAAVQNDSNSIQMFGITENENNFKPILVSDFLGTGQKHVINTAEAIQVLKLMIRTGSRPPFDIKAITQVLMKHKGSYSLNESCNVLYSYARLSFAHLPVLNFMSKHILEALSTQQEFIPKILISLLQSVCKLKYRNCELIESLCKKLNDMQHLLSTEQTTLCLFALSTVNVQSVYVDHFVDILSKLKNTDFNKTRNFLNYIWAAVILKKENILPVEHLEIVLSKTFLDQLTISGDNTLLNKIKLSNISGVACTLPNYKGPLLDDLTLSPVLSKSKNDFLASVRDSLSYIFPKAGFMEALSYAGSGVFIDVECCLDSSSNPILLKNKEKYNKIGIVLLDHSDFCLQDAALTGVTAFKIEIVKSRGYKLLTLSHSEFPFHGTLSSKIGYLRNKFKKALHASN